MRWRIAAIGFLALVLLLIAAALIVHAPPVRALALRYAIHAALSQGVRIESDGLDYNLATRHVRLARIRVSAVDSEEPFFVADEVAATVSSRVFRGDVAFDEVTVRNGAVRIVRREDGTTNLPKSSGGSREEPSPLPIARLSASRLAVEYRDEAGSVTVRVPALSVDLSSRGRLALGEPADVIVGSTSTRVESLESELAFDGRDLQLSGLRVATSELRAQVDGTLALLRREPFVDLRVTGDSALENSAKWWGHADDPPRGGLHVEGSVTGPLEKPTANLKLTSAGVSWRRLTIGDLFAQVRLDAEAVAVSESHVAVAGGRVTADGNLSWQGRARLNASWQNVDAGQLVTALSTTIAPSGRASGAITASGSIDSIESWDVDARATLDGGRRTRGRIPLPGEARFRFASGQWGLEARHNLANVAPLDISLTGRLGGSDLANSAVTGTVRVSESDLQAILQALSDVGVASVQQDVVKGSLRADADVNGTIGHPVIRINIDSDKASVAGQEVASVQARVRLDASTVDLEELSAVQPSTIGENSNGRVRVTGRYDLNDGTYNGSVNASSWRIVQTPDVPVSGVVSLEYAGRGRGRLAYGKARIISNLVVAPDFTLGDIVSDVELIGDRATITARAPQFNAVADANVGLSAPYPAMLRVEAQSLDLARAMSGLHLPVAIDGTASLAVQGDGSLAQLRDARASVEVAALDGHIQTLPVALRERARLRYDAGRAVVERLEASIGKTSVSVSGALPVSSGVGTPIEPEPVLAVLSGDLYDVAVAAAAAADAAPHSTEPYIVAGNGPVTLLARITGSIEAPTYAADLEVGPGMIQPRGDLAALENLQIRAHLEHGLLELRDFAASYHGANLTARGQAPLALLTSGAPAPGDGAATVHVNALGVTAAVLGSLVDPTSIGRVTGSLDARLDVSTPSLKVEEVKGELVLDRLDLSVADVSLRQKNPTRLVVSDGLARIESWKWEGEGTSLELDGQVHLSDRQAAIQAHGTFDARLLTPFIGAGLTTAGRVDTSLAITGALSEPAIVGEVRLADGEIRLREPRVVAGDLNAVATLARGSASVTSLTGTVNGGMLTGSGELQYAPERRADFMATVTGMAMDFPQGLRTEIDSSLQLTTTAKSGESPVSRLSGLVTVKRGGYREPLALVAGVLANLQRTAVPSGRAPSPFLQTLGLDVRVVTDEDLVIDNNVAKAQLGADLRVINVAAAPALSGRAELREGGQLFLGRNTYVVQSGTIDFSNPTVIEPILGVDATTRVSGVEVQVRITGPPDNLMTELTSPSDPALGQADLTALLLTGRRMNELTEGDAAIVGAQVLGNLAGDALGFAGRAVGLDTLRIGGVQPNTRDLADLASETDPTSRVTFGKSFGSKVDLTLSQSLRESAAQTWIIDYLPVRRIALRFVSNDDDLRSYEFRQELTFGAPQSIRSGDVSREVEQPRVSSIHISGDLAYPEPQLRDQLHLSEGERFDFINWQEDRDRLERFYHRQRHLAARITTGRLQSGAGVELTYMIEAGPETRVQVSGVSLPRRAIDDIETAWTRSVFDGFLIEEAEGIVRRELALQASYHPSLRVRIEGDELVRTLVIDVTPSPRAERIELRIEGVAESLRKDLLDAVGDRSHAVQALADPREFERAVLAVLQSWGYQQASVSVGEPVFEETVASIPVTVTPKAQFRLGSVAFEHASSIALAELRQEAALEEGALYRPGDVESARNRLQARYRQDGFTMISVEARQEISETAATVNVVFIVEEGPRQVVKEITISGQTSVREDVVGRALRLNVGDNLRTADWLEARRRLFESGLFRRVDIAVEPGTPGDTIPVTLRVAVEEWPPLRLRYGFQVAEERPEENVNGRDLVPGVSVDVTRRALFGRAITVGVAAQYERRDRLGRLFVNTPTLFGRGIQSSLILERSRAESPVDTLVTDLTTTAWEQRGHRGPLSLSYGLRFERNRTFDTNPDPILPFDLTVHIGSLTASATWDTRDDPSDSTRGTFVSTSLEHASATLGSDLLFVRTLTQAYHFRRLKQVVLASAVRYGSLNPLRGQELQISSLLFFAGGARTIRGVAEDSVRGVDFLGNPIGGKGLLTLNQEMRFPVYRWLRGVAFVDSGNVFEEPTAVRLRELVGSAGVGVRFVTPFVLLRVDYGKTIWNKPISDTGRWVFGIGQTF